MPRFVCLPRWSWMASAFACGALLAEPSGHASTAVSIYTAASRVEMLPAEANATEVVIHGAFMFIDTSGGYSDAVCGFMYFRCPAGSETMCRMQWLDIRTMGTGTTQCAGFGAQNVVSAARVRSEGTALSAPDTWDLGVGVVPGSFIDGKCAPARALACAQPVLSDGGAADVPLSTDAWLAVDGASSDRSAAADTGAYDLSGAEIAGTMDSAAEHAPAPNDSAPVDTASPPDVLALDLPGVDAAVVADLPVYAPDAGVDRSTGTPRDTSPGAPNDVPVTNSSGCSCHLASPQGGSRPGFPAGLVVFAALIGVAALRRASR